MKPNPPEWLLRLCGCYRALKSDDDRATFRFWRQPCACSANLILNPLVDLAEDLGECAHCLLDCCEEHGAERQGREE